MFFIMVFIITIANEIRRQVAIPAAVLSVVMRDTSGATIKVNAMAITIQMMPITVLFFMCSDPPL